jgi:AhpD family alkylhydroperoxidase
MANSHSERRETDAGRIKGRVQRKSVPGKGNTQMSKNYPKHYEHLRELMGRLGRDIPQTMGAFSKLHHASVSDGVLSAREKELISLGIAITVRCDGCIAFHVHDALEAGASRDEITETIGVAVLMGGGPAVMYGCEALEALEQFEALKVAA